MKLNARERYAVTAMLDLALSASNRTDAPCSVGQLALRQDLPRTYMEQLFAVLRRNGLVRSVRGTAGGYRLSREASDISIGEVLAALDTKVDMTRCAAPAIAKAATFVCRIICGSN